MLAKFTFQWLAQSSWVALDCLLLLSPTTAQALNRQKRLGIQCLYYVALPLSSPVKLWCFAIVVNYVATNLKYLFKNEENWLGIYLFTKSVFFLTLFKTPLTPSFWKSDWFCFDGLGGTLYWPKIEQYKA